MTILEKISYLKGVIEGAKLDAKPENKVLVEIVEVLGQIADELENQSVSLADLEDYVEELDGDLADVEEEIGLAEYDDDDDFDDEDEDDDEDDSDEDDDEDEEEEEDEDDHGDHPCGCGHHH